MGSKSDLPVMQEAIDILKGFDIETEVDIVSAHRTPEKSKASIVFSNVGASGLLIMKSISAFAAAIFSMKAVL